MGEVYRAVDTRLAREIAVKVLPDDLFESAERRQRFEREARLLASLNHPNIAVLHSFEEVEGRHLLVMELLDGESLRAALDRGPLSRKRAIDIAVQMASALFSAHEKGIVHRDVKPENVFLTREGRAKLLDFGIARHRQQAASDTVSPTLTATSEPGTVVGTVGYMSPEQVLGKPLDARTDVFSLGVVLYEMLSGKRPFQGKTAPETMTAILREDPPELSGTNKSISPGLERIVRHCLEKEPSGRFQSARDVAFALESLTQATTDGTLPLKAVGRRRWLAAAAIGAALIVATASGFFTWGKRAGKEPWPTFKRVTFRRGLVQSARFTPDFQSVVYSAAWEGQLPEVFVQRLASPDARSLGVSGGIVLVEGTAGGDVVILRNTPFSIGTLSQLPLEGGTPRDLLHQVQQASWNRSGTRLAVVRVVKGRWRVECPVGKVLLESTGLEQIVGARLSPDEKRIAFFSLPKGTNYAVGDVCVVDLEGRKQVLSKGWTEIGWTGSSLVWSPDGSEVWFSASRTGISQQLHGVTLSGKERLVARLPGNVVVQDIAPDGRALVAFGQARRFETRGRLAGDAAERSLSWLDGTFAPLLSPDGTQMLFQEYGEAASGDGGNAEGWTYFRRMDGSAPKRIANGSPSGVSPDWTTALVVAGTFENMHLKLVPIGAGESRTLPRGPVQSFSWALWTPDGKRIVIVGSDGEGQTRLFVQDPDGGPPRPFARLEELPFYPWLPFTPDSRFVAARPRHDAPPALYPIDGGEPRPIPFLKAGDVPAVFSDDGRFLFVADDAFAPLPRRVVRLDLKGGKREPWLELAPPDRAGLGLSQGQWLTPDGRFYAYSYQFALSDLYLVEGLR